MPFVRKLVQLQKEGSSLTLNIVSGSDRTYTFGVTVIISDICEIVLDKANSQAPLGNAAAIRRKA